jgi:hypothetical protein
MLSGGGLLPLLAQTHECTTSATSSITIKVTRYPGLTKLKRGETKKKSKAATLSTDARAPLSARRA